MIRFLEGGIHCINENALNRNELYDYFLHGHQEDIVCVMVNETYLGYITYASLIKNDNLYESIQEDYLILDETIWQNGKKFFQEHNSAKLLPVLNKAHQLVCLAWQDKEANRELRMLRELEECGDALTFQDLNPGYTGITIHGCNELAWHFAAYLIKRKLAVNVDGEFWNETGIWKNNTIWNDQNYAIWAEGVHHKSGKLNQERLRSASVEFECIDEIYEANIKAGKITDAEGNAEDLLKRLQEEKEIVIRGTGTKAQDAYDWLLANGIDICAFQSDKPQQGRKTLFGRPVLRKCEVTEQFSQAVIIECGAKHSAWGFGDVDSYDYEGYKRNQRYFLLRDYIAVPENNLRHVLAGKNLVLAGDLRLCNRVYKYLLHQQINIGKIGYWDILDENKNEIQKFQISEIGNSISKGTIYLLVKVQYSSNIGITKEAADKQAAYIDMLATCGADDYTDYFSDMAKSIHLGTGVIKYNHKKLLPAGILLGAIPPHCGNTLVKQSLAGHPQIIEIEEYGFFNNDLYSICIRLAEEKPDSILDNFWKIIQKTLEKQYITICFPERTRFDNKMLELLKLDDQFTSQELFIMFHLAYNAMFRKESEEENMVIYWEPHMWDRRLVKEFAFWLHSKDLKGFTLGLARNKYIWAGSCIKDGISGLGWKIAPTMYGEVYVKDEKKYDNWEECVIKFEELKCRPEEMLTMLCRWIGISFHKSLMETTWHGKPVFYDTITGFDTKPAYNLYEEYFSCFDRMRICIIAASYQKQYGYPYVSCLAFSRRELQEMFLKNFRWEELPQAAKGKEDAGIWNLQERIRHLLWSQRYAEITKSESYEES